MQLLDRAKRWLARIPQQDWQAAIFTAKVKSVQPSSVYLLFGF
jgi:hypothetical protein